MGEMFTLDIVSTGFKTMIMLGIVLSLLILVVYFLKKTSFFKRQSKGEVIISVISSMHLSPKERIEVIEVFGEKIVLGITPGNISFLTKLHDIGDTSGINEENKENHI